MIEGGWLTCTNPTLMLEYLAHNRSERKSYLFAAASFRRLLDLLPDWRHKQGIEWLELKGEGICIPQERRGGGVAMGIRNAFPPDELIDGNHPYYVVLMLYRAIVSRHAAEHALHAASGRADGAAEQRDQTTLLRDIFGNPFRPTACAPTWLTWNDGTVRKIAQIAYDERQLPSGHLDAIRLAVLADALEEAGCDQADILDHCRGAGPHVRGCWAVDLLLGKK